MSAALCKNVSEGVLLGLWTLLGSLERALKPVNDSCLLIRVYSGVWPQSLLDCLVASGSACMIAGAAKGANTACSR